MILRQMSTIYIPQTYDGIRYATLYEEKLKDSNISYHRKEDTQSIIIQHDIMWTEDPKNF